MENDQNCLSKRYVHGETNSGNGRHIGHADSTGIDPAKPTEPGFVGFVAMFEVNQEAHCVESLAG